MGYDTAFEGSIKVEPPLNGPEIKYLHDFARTRHCQNRSGPYTILGPNPARGPGVHYNARFEGLPGLWCQWVPNEDGTALVWNGAEKFYSSTEWMRYLIDTFLGPHALLKVEQKNPHPGWEYPPAFEHFTCNHTLNGVITAQGEDQDDKWTVIVEDGDVSERKGHPPFTGPAADTIRVALTRSYDLPKAALEEAGGEAAQKGTAEAVAEHLGASELISLLDSEKATETECRATVYDAHGGEAALDMEGAPPAHSGRVAVQQVSLAALVGEPGQDNRLASEVAEQAESLFPNVKVALLKAMGFTPYGFPHQLDCSGLNSGARCNCVPPATMWSQPKDVDVFRKETWEGRCSSARRRAQD